MKEKKHICVKCQKGFTRYDNLLVHISDFCIFNTIAAAATTTASTIATTASTTATTATTAATATTIATTTASTTATSPTVAPPTVATTMAITVPTATTVTTAITPITVDTTGTNISTTSTALTVIPENSVNPIDTNILSQFNQMMLGFQNVLEKLDKKIENNNSNKEVVVVNKQDLTDDKKVEIVCLAKENYIKKLEDLHDGDIDKALMYIKNIGIATDFLEGDFRLIKKIYFDGKKKSEFPIRVKDFKRNRLEFLEENGEWILDIQGEIVGKRLCDNIVNTLLIANKMFSDMIINEKDEDKKELLLDLYQINKTQAHILKLTERKTQCKLSRRVAEFINFCTEMQLATGSHDGLQRLESTPMK
jgi:hypothetical protein